MSSSLKATQDERAVAAARGIIAKHWDGKLPVDIYRIARAMGVTVRLHQFPNETVTLTGHWDKKPVILLSQQCYDAGGTRPRFAVAHALGHLVLHGDQLPDLQAEYGIQPPPSNPRP